MPIVVPDAQIEQLSAGELRTLLATVRTAQRRLDSLVYRISARADALAAEGRAAPADELLLGTGEVRAATARLDAARARTVAELPGLSEAVAAGRIGGDHVDAITRRLRPLGEEERRLIDSAAVVADAERLPVDTFDAALRRTVDQIGHRARSQEQEVRRAASSFRHWFDHRAGMGRFTGQLDAERYEALTSAIDQQVDRCSTASDEPVAKGAHLAAEALVELVCATGERRWRRPHLVVVTDHATLARGPHAESVIQTGNGHDLSAEALSRITCDATVRRVTVGGDRPLSTGRRFRTATDFQWDALRSMYAGCAWLGCDRPLSWCQAHHILEWERGGRGELDNLVPLCSRHHHAVHEGGWSIRLGPDRALEIRRPDGAHLGCTDPPTRRLSGEHPPAGGRTAA